MFGTGGTPASASWWKNPLGWKWIPGNLEPKHIKPVQLQKPFTSQLERIHHKHSERPFHLQGAVPAVYLCVTQSGQTHPVSAKHCLSEMRWSFQKTKPCFGLEGSPHCESSLRYSSIHQQLGTRWFVLPGLWQHMSFCPATPHLQPVRHP